MTGLTGMNQGIGLDIVPSASLTNRRVLRADNPATPTVDEADTSDDEFEPSLDLFYKLTPQLNGVADVQHGFLGDRGRRPASESHALRLVLSRRSATSSCATPTSSSSAASARRTARARFSNAERQNARPFFSRRIGLGGSASPSI